MTLIFPLFFGTKQVFSGEIFFDLQIVQGRGNQEQGFAVGLYLKFLGHFMEEEVLTWSVEAKNIRSLDGRPLPQEFLTHREVLHINSEDGMILEFYTQKNSNQLMQSILRSIANRLQMPSPIGENWGFTPILVREIVTEHTSSIC